MNARDHLDSLFEGKKPGLWDNMRKARKAGKRKKRPGQKGYPSEKAIEQSQK